MRTLKTMTKMKKFKSLLMIALFALTLTSCDESFNDWLTQNVNEAPEMITVGGLTFSPASVIDFRTLDETVTRVKVADITPVSASEGFDNVIYSLIFDGDVIEIDADGTVDRAELEALVAKVYGRNPVERTLEATIQALVTNGSTTTRVNSATKLQVKCIPNAPVIESAYYYIGSANNWTPEQVSAFPMSNGGVDQYENPVFNIVVPMTDGSGNPADNWFKIVPASALDRDNFWDGDFVGYAENGANGFTGKVAIGQNDAVAYAFKVALDDVAGAGYIKISVNFMDETFEITPVDYTEFIYEVGVNTGWSSVVPLHCYGNSGEYEGFAWLNGEFKFRPNENNWDGDWEYVEDGVIGDTGGPNIPAPETGYYKIDVSLPNMTYKLTAISTISLIGSAVNGDTSWGTDYDMTYNESTGMWEITATLTDGEMKFRANHDWAINWGPDDNIEGSLKQGGANIPVSAGTYEIALKAWCDGGPAVFTMTKK